jgi:hypothetical protein
MNKKIFTRLIIPGIIILFIITIGCEPKKAEWGNLENGLILKYRLPQDHALTYTRSADIVLTNEVPGQSIETIIRIDTNYSIKGSGVDDQNNLMARIIINDINMTITGPQGITKPDTSGLKGKSFNAIHSPNGKELEVTDVDDLPKINLTQGVEGDVKYLFKNLLPKLPDSAVKTGDSWTTPRDIKLQQGPITYTMKGETTSVLEGVETIQGMECVKIKSHTKLAGEGSGTVMEQAWNLIGDTASTSTWYFAYKKGMLVKGTINNDGDSKVTAGVEEMPLTTKAKAEIELVL